MKTLERELKRGTLELLLLRILADEPTYGYELVKRLRERSGGRFRIQEGTLYPVLYRLEDAGLVEPEWTRPSRGVPRKVYRLTEAGVGRVAELTDAWRDFSTAIEAILESPEPRREEPEGPAPEEEES